MRKPKTYRVERGFLSGEGKSKTEAKAALEREIDFVCSAASPHIECRFGLLIVIAAAPNGYQHAIVYPENMVHGKITHPSTHHASRDFTEVLIAARMHAAQNAWSSEVADDEAFIEAAGFPKADVSRRDLASWIKFQRNYKALKDSGVSDTEAFNRASIRATAA